ncbi:DASH complex subunit Dad1-domain-containing protein [Triangularia setosa]|uniref:DASH complex subunit DAD1 n=1 Tax=Triangularia setosa TaxID=2587417 RepID=A0AAN6W231_9PEZI|nr:DASH complex subunit Dad1-domain-containing protein [Podospora setosa]
MPQRQRSQSVSGPAMGTREKSYFELQREELISEIAMSFEHVLANINKLNRSLEAVIAVGNEFSSVEALWSTFENVMAKEEDTEEGRQEGHDEGEEGEEEKGDEMEGVEHEEGQSRYEEERSRA